MKVKREGCMKYMICPDSFKGSLSALEAAEAMRQGVLLADPTAEIECIPLADGGEGTADILNDAMKGFRRECTVSGPTGIPVRAHYYIMSDRTAVMDAASAIGLYLVPPTRRNVMKASSRGVGEMIYNAFEHGAERIVLGLGGSATCDGGRGMWDILSEVRCKMKGHIKVLCDVDNPMYGYRGAAYVFAPQKGANPDQVVELDRMLLQWHKSMMEMGGHDVSELPGAGAAGGIAGMLASMFDAQLIPGIEYVIEAVGLKQAIAMSDVVLTGEGCVDSQTMAGKTLSGVLKVAADFNKPVHAFGGKIKNKDQMEGYFKRLVCITPEGMALEQAMDREQAFANLRKSVYICEHEPYNRDRIP